MSSWIKFWRRVTGAEAVDYGVTVRYLERRIDELYKRNDQLQDVIDQQDVRIHNLQSAAIPITRAKKRKHK
jgi:prefoldin subunit 5